MLIFAHVKEKLQFVVFPHFFPTISPRIFPQDFHLKCFSPKSTPNIYPHFFAPRLSPIALRLLPLNFPLVFPQNVFSILIINFYLLLFSLKFFPHSSQNCAPICLPPSLLPNLPPRFFPSQTFALKLSSIFSHKKLSPKHFTPTFTPMFTPTFYPQDFQK